MKIGISIEDPQQWNCLCVTCRRTFLHKSYSHPHISQPSWAHNEWSLSSSLFPTLSFLIPLSPLYISPFQSIFFKEKNDQLYLIKETLANFSILFYTACESWKKFVRKQNADEEIQKIIVWFCSQNPTWFNSFPNTDKYLISKNIMCGISMWVQITSVMSCET